MASKNSWWSCLSDPDDDEDFPLDDDGNAEFWYEDDPDYTEIDDDECVMCGKERSLNDKGYCSQCWQVWNS